MLIKDVICRDYAFDLLERYVQGVTMKHMASELGFHQTTVSNYLCSFVLDFLNKQDDFLFGYALNKVRKDSCLTIGELSEKIGISEGTISRYEGLSPKHLIPRDLLYSRRFHLFFKSYAPPETAKPVDQRKKKKLTGPVQSFLLKQFIHGSNIANAVRATETKFGFPSVRGFKTTVATFLDKEYRKAKHPRCQRMALDAVSEKFSKDSITSINTPYSRDPLNKRDLPFTYIYSIKGQYWAIGPAAPRQIGSDWCPKADLTINFETSAASKHLKFKLWRCNTQ